MGSWITAAHQPTSKANMRFDRVFLSTNTVNGKIYAIGGLSSAGDILSIVEEYDPATDTWTTKADMPTTRVTLSACAVNGKIYVIGGHAERVGLTSVEEYDPATDTWTRKADMPTGRFALSTSAVNGKIYAIGGCTSPWKEVSTVEEYDPAKDTWTRKAEIPTPRFFLSTSAVNGKVYAIGGCVDVHGVTFSTVETYDPAIDTWTEKADMPTPRKALATNVVNGKIYAIGGSAEPHWDAGISTVEEYDPGLPPPDFNGDFKIDIEDLIILIEHWGTDEPSVDIAPPPSGDGIVDVQDLEVFMSYWGQEVYDPRLIAHWKLDETEGDIAYDSATHNDAVVFGDAIWQLIGGQIDGALQFDGIDDYVSAPLMLDPANAVFSVFAWVKGGMSGQVVFSQAGLSDWLGADTTNGSLMTELKFIGKPSLPLQSQTVIADNNWHRVGLVWDGSNRILYVDDVQVASDTYDKGWLVGGLQIGAGKNLGPSTFWSGLIDDVRIYNRAVKP